jgi:fatty-acid desaturase
MENVTGSIIMFVIFLGIFILLFLYLERLYYGTLILITGFTLLYMVCCVFQATNLVNNCQPRKSARTFASKQEASNKLYTVLATDFFNSN